MALSEGQRDRLLQQIAADLRAIRRILEPEPEERPAATRKRDPRKLYREG